MEIIDAQIHRPSPSMRVGEPSTSDGNSELDLQLALSAMDAVGVNAAIVHTDRIFAQAACASHPDRFAAVVQFTEPLKMLNAGEVIANLRSSPGILGFRLAPVVPQVGGNLMAALREGRLAPLFASAETHGVPLALFIPGGLGDVPAIAETYPNLPLIIDHIGMPPPPWVPFSADLLNDLPKLLALARYPNVALKFTGVPALSLEAYPFKDLWHRGLHQIVESFTPQRLMWGSDYTRLKGVLTYSELLNFLLYTDELSQGDKEAMLSHSARNWFRWPRI
jgi:L-fuconolactonase